jgi:outer membrane protein OmpA-like peptidoglycan-associated protein
VLIVVFVIATVLMGLGFFLGAGHQPAVHDMVVITEKTTRTPGVLASEVRQRILALADSGAGGQLAVHAVGARDSALPPVDLAVLRDNERENDPGRRAAAVGRRLATLSRELAAVPVGREGFNLVAAFQAAASAASKTNGRVEIWLQTTVLTSSSDPLRMAALTATDPEQAVKDVMGSTKIGTLDLSRVDLHPVLLPPVGDNQEPLTPWDNAWRSTFITDLGSALGARVSPPVLTDSSGPPWSAASTVPLIPAHQESTPHVPTAPGEQLVVIDTAAFVPDTATLLDPEKTQAKVAAMIARYQQANGNKSWIEVQGFTAAFGDAESARVLSRQRAVVLGHLLATTRPARLASNVAIAHVFPVTSSATSSAGPKPCANARTPAGVVANLPACVITPSCQIATCAKCRCTSSPMHRRCNRDCITLFLQRSNP